MASELAVVAEYASRCSVYVRWLVDLSRVSLPALCSRADGFSVYGVTVSMSFEISPGCVSTWRMGG